LPHRKPFLPHKPRTPPRTPQQGSSTILFENRRRTIFYLVIVNCTIISQDTNGYQGRKQEGQGCPHSFQHSTQRCPHSGWGCWCRWQEGTAAAGWLFRWFIRTSRSDSTRYLPPLASCLLLLPPASCLLPPASCLHYSFSFIFFFFIFGLAVTNSLFSILILSTLFSILYSLSLSSPSPSPSPSFLVAMASDPRLAQMVGVCSSSSYSSSFHILFQFTPTPPFFQQEKLGSIVGMSTGFPADFPAPIRRRLNALKNLLVPISWPLSRSISRSN